MFKLHLPDTPFCSIRTANMDRSHQKQSWLLFIPTTKSSNKYLVVQRPVIRTAQNSLLRHDHWSNSTLINLFHQQPFHLISFILAITFDLVLCMVSYLGKGILCSCFFCLMYFIPLESIIFVFSFSSFSSNTSEVSCSGYGQDTGV